MKEAMGPRRITAGSRREIVNEAALRLFAERGYHGVSLDEIAAEAGVTKPVVYDHVVSKADLYAGLLERQHEELLAHVLKHLTGEGDLENRVRSALDTLLDWARTRPFSWRLLFADDTTGNRNIASKHASLQARANEVVASRVLEDLSSHSFPDRLTVEIVGQVLGGVTRSIIRWWHDNPLVPQELVADVVMKVVWQGLAQSFGRPENRGSPS